MQPCSGRTGRGHSTPSTSTGQPNRVASPKSLRCLVWLCVCVRIAWYGTHRFLQQALRLLPTDDGLNLELGRLLTTVHDHTGAVKVQQSGSTRPAVARVLRRASRIARRAAAARNVRQRDRLAWPLNVLS